jgi:hypothetical protein
VTACVTSASVAIHLPARRYISGTKRWKSLSHILVPGYVLEIVLTVGSTEPWGSVKAYQGFREDEVMFKKVHYILTKNTSGARGGVVVKALRYKPAGRGFDSRWCHWNFSVT